MMICTIALLALSSFAAPITFGLSPQDPESFDKGLSAVERRMDKGQWGKAAGDLRELLADNHGAAYVYREKPRILQDMERIALFSAVDPPSADEVLAARVKKYDPVKGKIELEMSSKEFGDLVKQGDDIYVLPTAFTGPYTVGMSGPIYPTSEQITIMIGLDTDQMFYLQFGSQASLPAVSVKRDGGEQEFLETSEKHVMDPGRPFSLEVEVKATKITVKANKKRLFTIKREKKDQGLFAFYGFDDYEREGLEITIKGEVDTSWVSGLIDEAMQAKRSEFEQGYRPQKHLPEWLFDEEAEAAAYDADTAGDSAAEPAGGGEDGDSGSLVARANKGRKKPSASAKSLDSYREYPGAELGAGARDVLRSVRDAYGDEDADHDELLAEVDQALTDGDLHQAAADYLRMEVHLLYGFTADATEAARRAVAADPEHLPTILALSRLLLKMKDFDSCRTLLADATERWPGLQEILYQRIELEMLTQHMEVAQDLIQEAQVKGKGNAELDSLREQIDKAVSGPHWAKTYSFQSRHYDVQSDISEDICKEAANLLESAYTSYSVHLQKIKGLEKNKFRVFLFSGQSGYLRYVSESIGQSAENTAGVYQGFFKQLLIWNVPDREQMFRTIVHEGFHQYLDQIASEAPRWFNEGMAEYLELYETVNGRFTEGQINRDHLELLQQEGLMPLESFLTMPVAAFYEQNVMRNYAEGWAFMHFLRNGGGDKEKLFDALFEGFASNPSTGRVIFEVFQEVDMDKLEQEFVDYLNQLRKS